MAVGDTGSRLVGNTEFYGGLSTDKKIGIENSFSDAECLDVRKSPSQMTVLPMSRELDDANVITGLITAMCQTKDGNIWALDENGKLYQIDDNNSVNAINTPAASTGHGLVYSSQNDALWFADGAAGLYSYGAIINPTGVARQVNSFSVMEDNSEYIEATITTDYSGAFISNSNLKRKDAQYTIAVPTTISETEANKALFLPGLSPVNKIGIRFSSKGSGNVYIVIHDKNNNRIAQSSPIAAANVSTSGYTEFAVLPDPNSPASASNQTNLIPWAGDLIEAGGEYHIHIVASTSGFAVQTTQSGTMYYGLNLKSWGNVLYRTHNGKHPVAIYDKIYVGNGQYVAALQSSPINYIDDTMYLPHRLRLDDGFEVCSIATSDEYMIIGAEKFSLNSSRGFQAGKIYFWDRESDGPNFSIECNMGSPQCIYNFGNIVYIIVNGALYAYTGGKELIKVRTLKGTDTEFSGVNSVTEVYPNMMATRREVMMVGFPSKTTAYGIRHGVHGWGSIDKNYPNCFTYNYRVPGVGSQYNSDTQQLRIGCVYNFSDTLFYGYEVNGDPALAVVDNESGASTSFFWQSLQYDAGSPALEKEGLRIGVYFDPLPEGCTITPMFRIDNGDWEDGVAFAKAGDRYITCEVNRRIHEFQYGFKGTTPNNTQTPVIKQVAAEVRLLNEERKL